MTTHTPLAEILGLPMVGEFDLALAWSAAHAAFPAMRIPIGVDESGETASLRLHEMAIGGDGPFAMVIGPHTSRTQALRTILLSTCASLDPEDVDVLLVDTRASGVLGGEELKRLHHVRLAPRGDDPLRVVWDEERARQELFARAGVDCIHDYRRMRTESEHHPALKTWIVFVDDATDLVGEGHASRSLASSLAVGRSLGIHFILGLDPNSPVLHGPESAQVSICLDVSRMAETGTAALWRDSAAATEVITMPDLGEADLLVPVLSRI